MKKLKVKRIIATLLMTIMCVTSIIGCGSNDVPEEVIEVEEEEDIEENYENVKKWPTSTSKFLGKKLVADLDNRYFDLTDVSLGMVHGKRIRANVIYKDIITIQMKGQISINTYKRNFRRYTESYSVDYDRDKNITNLSFKLNKSGRAIKKGKLISTIKTTDISNNAQVLIDVYKGY